MSASHPIEVQIMGQSYVLAAPEEGELHLRNAVQRVDSAMCQIRDGGKIKARDRIAVLAALNLAFEQTQAPAAPVADGASDPKISALIARLDHALNGDGQLL
jgi:cell division protein ZapA